MDLATADRVLYGKELAQYQRFLAYPPAHPHWQPAVVTEDDYRRIAVPSLAFTGWFDGTLPGTIAHYKGLQSSSPLADRHYILVGPWEHLTAPDGGHHYTDYNPVTQVGDLQLDASAFVHGLELTREFFDWCLQGLGDFNYPSSRIYVTGSNRWVESGEFPDERAVSTSLYLDDTALSFAPPQSAGSRSYNYDPRDPFPSQLTDENGGVRSLNSLPLDISSLLERDDTLIYTSAPMEQPITVIGDVELLLHAATDAVDTDFMALIEDVAPDGSAIKLGPRVGAHLRTRFRDGPDGKFRPTAGEVVEYRLSFPAIGHTFLPGHRIRLTITSSAYPLIFPNPNTGDDSSAHPVSARQVIHSGGDSPSRLELPVYEVGED